MVGEHESCPHINSCEMYRLFKFSGTIAVWKINYCQSDFTRCERFQRAKDGEEVPPNLMPNGATLYK